MCIRDRYSIYFSFHWHKNYKNRPRNAGDIIDNVSGCFFLNTVYITQYILHLLKFSYRISKRWYRFLIRTQLDRQYCAGYWRMLWPYSGRHQSLCKSTVICCYLFAVTSTIYQHARISPRFIRNNLAFWKHKKSLFCWAIFNLSLLVRKMVVQADKRFNIIYVRSTAVPRAEHWRLRCTDCILVFARVVHKSATLKLHMCEQDR